MSGNRLTIDVNFVRMFVGGELLMAELRYTFKHDILFKMFFLRHQEQLKFLIALILRIPLGSITEFMIINTEMPPEAIGGKFSHLDINMKVNGNVVDLEI